MTSLSYLRDLPSKMRAASHDRNGLSPSFFPKILAMRFFNFTRSSAGPKRNGYRTAFSQSVTAIVLDYLCSILWNL